MKKILLVDDDPNLCRVLKYQLSGMGLMVEEVSDGGSAVERCLESNYALIVADVNIPVMVGLSFLQLIKLRHPKIPVIVLSAFSSMENVATAFRYGADDFLEKPCELETLRDKIQRLMT